MHDAACAKHTNILPNLSPRACPLDGGSGLRAPKLVRRAGCTIVRRFKTPSAGAAAVPVVASVPLDPVGHLRVHLSSAAARISSSRHPSHFLIWNTQAFIVCRIVMRSPRPSGTLSPSYINPNLDLPRPCNDPPRPPWHLTRPRTPLARLTSPLRKLPARMRICPPHRPSHKPGSGSRKRARNSGARRTHVRGTSICRRRGGPGRRKGPARRCDRATLSRSRQEEVYQRPRGARQAVLSEHGYFMTTGRYPFELQRNCIILSTALALFTVQLPPIRSPRPVARRYR
ncbi:hypothetical protein B0H21DRAFT_219560 [Amylocystis lapponica]|nr:hypothetical protein B0H21DRAFT_219560 [Amylocystis lapponica]